MAQIYISLGTCIEREKHLKQGLTALKAAFGTLTLSSLFESEAVGFNGPAFYNMVIGAQTTQSIADVVKELKQIERDNGRVPSAQKFSSRTLDLDLLLYDNKVFADPIELPRDEITKNAFVLWPLAELAGDLCHPVNGQSYQALWQAFDKNKQQLTPVPFHWSE